MHDIFNIRIDDNEFDLIEEASHGKLKNSFRTAINIENGHKIKIVFDLNTSDIHDVGSPWQPDSIKSDQRIKNNVKKNRS